MFDHFNAFITLAAGYLWGWPMLFVLVLTGLWLTFHLRGMQFWMLWPALKKAFGAEGRMESGPGNISNRAALMTALAATVGTGNIAGVATAVALGGPGAVFWMWMSGLLGLAMKYGETMLGVHYRVRTADGEYRGGPMYYLRDGVGSKVLGGLYALFLAMATFAIGGAVQSNSIADAVGGTFGWSPTWVGLVIVVAAGAIMFGGLKRIAQAADKLVPTMIALYVATGALIILTNLPYVPGIFADIFTYAFTPHAAVGGATGGAVMLAMRYGLARGVFSNESGLGSAAVVAATARTKHPVEQALVSMTQTFIDTIIVCTFTALVILLTGAWVAPEALSAGASLTSLAFDSGLGNIAVLGHGIGSVIVAVCVALFAFTTILGWGYYGQQGAVYLFGPKVAQPYLLLFLVATFCGAAVLDWAGSVREGVLVVWTVADVLVGLMMLPNLFALWVLTPTIKRLTFDYLGHTYKGKTLAVKAFHNDAASRGFAPLVAKAQQAAKPAAKPVAKPKMGGRKAKRRK
jgi:AGCS family alanine or glycine:cation symporter